MEKNALVKNYCLRGEKKNHCSHCLFTRPIILIPHNPIRSASIRMKVTYSQTLCALSVQ